RQRMFSFISGHQVSDVKPKRLFSESGAKREILAVALVISFEEIAQPCGKHMFIPVLYAHRRGNLLELLGSASRGIGKGAKHSAQQRLVFVDGRHQQLVEIQQERQGVEAIEGSSKRASQPQVCR